MSTNTPETLSAQLIEHWSAKGVDPATLRPDDKGTLHDDSRVDGKTLAEWAARTTPPSHGSLAPEELTLGPVIGRGGMGVVRVGTQSALRRQVAVKELREGPLEANVVASLLREAWVSGNLEHPNIVPIHVLVPGDNGPRLVMKRVEGTEWLELMHASPDLLRDLTILQRVCHAVHFAHSRGVLHLDLKPANVMIGAYGEVYLVDWGLAAARTDDAPAWLPRAADIARPCGTPAYLAPEAASGEGKRIGVATDVYGLGVLLHEVLAKKPRHTGATLYEVLLNAYISAPFEYPAGVPRELAAIANRAMARAPEDRFADAEAFRVAIEGFLAHRSALQLADDAARRLERLEALTTDKPPAQRTTAGQALIERLFTECRVAYEQALALWPDSKEARAGKTRLLSEMIEDALAARQWRRAAAYLEDLDPAFPEHAALSARVIALREELADAEAHVERLKRHEHETDFDFNRLARSRMTLIIGALWLAWNLGSAWLVKHVFELTYVLMFASSGAVLVVYGIGVFMFRKSLLTTRVNRGVVILFGAWLSVVMLYWIGAMLMGLPPLETIAASNAMYLAFAVAVACLLDRRVFWSALVIAPATPIGMAYPEWAFEIAALVGSSLCLGLAWTWRRPARASDR